MTPLQAQVRHIRELWAEREDLYESARLLAMSDRSGILRHPVVRDRIRDDLDAQWEAVQERLQRAILRCPWPGPIGERISEIARNPEPGHLVFVVGHNLMTYRSPVPRKGRLRKLFRDHEDLLECEGPHAVP